MRLAIGIVLIIGLIEAGLAVCSLARRSALVRWRQVVPVAALAAFVALTYLGVLEWGLRYAPLAAVLLARAMIGAAQLLRRGPEPPAFRVGRTVRRALLTTLLLWLAALPAVLFPQHGPIATTGAYQVGSVVRSWVDPDRVEAFGNGVERRRLTVEFWYPSSGDGPFPLIVFSHGAFGVRRSNLSLFNELASHGYIVASIDHTHHSLYSTDEEGRRTWIDPAYMRELSAENARANPEQSLEYYLKWMDVRTGDIGFVLNQVLAEGVETGNHDQYGPVDPDRIGVMGHSLGGSAALGIGRARDDVGAVIALEAPLLLDIVAVSEGEFVLTEEAYPVPLLNVYSDAGWRILPDAPQYAANYALLVNAPADAFSVHLQGVGHLGLTDLTLASPLLTRVFDGTDSVQAGPSALSAINELCLRFFDHYLKGQGDFRPPLQR